MASNPLLSILQGEDPNATEAPVAPPPSVRATVAAVPTLGVIGGPPAPQAAPPAAPQAAQGAEAAATPAPGRKQALQGPQVAQAPPKFHLPPVEKMVEDYQRWQMMAADPEVAKEVAPRMQAWRNLTLQQHAKAFQGDPMASPEQAAAYARHMGQIQGQLSQPMPWEEAAKIAEYTQGQKSKLPTQFLEGMNRYDKAAVQPFIDDVFGDGWTLQSLAPGKVNIGGNEVEVPSITVVGPNGEVRTRTSVDVSAMFGNFEGAYKLAELNRKRDLEAAQADLDLARANRDPAAAAAAYEKLTTLKGGLGNIGPGNAAGGGTLQHAPTVAAALQETNSPLDPEFVLAVIEHESGGNVKAKSPKNAQGVMQLIPDTARRFDVKDIYNPEENIRGGVKYLNFLYKKFNGDLQKVAAGYNAGEGRVDQYGGVPPFKETQAYVRNVLGTYQKHKGQPAPDTAALGQRLVNMPIGSTTETRNSAYTPALVAEQAKAKRAYNTAREAIRKEGLGAKEEARRLQALDDDWGVSADAPAAAPAGMPAQPPGAAGKPPAAAAAKPAAKPTEGAAKAKTDDELKALIDAAYG